MRLRIVAIMQSVERSELLSPRPIEQFGVLLVAICHVRNVLECIPVSRFAGFIADFWRSSGLPDSGDGLGRKGNSPQGCVDIRGANFAEKLR